jgi:RAD3-like DEAD/DEAH box helicase
VDIMALQVGVAFLGLDFGRLSALLAESRRRLNDLLTDANLATLSGTMFGPAQSVVIAVSSLLSYLRNGDSQQLENARAALNNVILGTAGQGDHDAKWVAAHLLSIANGMATSSVWSVLPPSLPPEAASSVARAFTYGAPPVLTLWPPQVELLTRDRRNPLDIASNRLLLSVPTSAGKTLLAQVIICAHLAQTNGDVCFVTPLRSLGREVRQSLGRRVRMLNRRVGPELPDFADFFEALLSAQGAPSRGDVEIMTPERLMQLMRRDPAATLDRFSLFVIDEAQMLADPGRGLLLEGLLSMLAVTPVRMVLLSGVLVPGRPCRCGPFRAENGGPVAC